MEMLYTHMLGWLMGAFFLLDRLSKMGSQNPWPGRAFQSQRWAAKVKNPSLNLIPKFHFIPVQCFIWGWSLHFYRDTAGCRWKILCQSSTRSSPRNARTHITHHLSKVCRLFHHPASTKVNIIMCCVEWWVHPLCPRHPHRGFLMSWRYISTHVCHKIGGWMFSWKKWSSIDPSYPNFWSLCILVGWIPFLGGYPHNCGWNPNVCWLLKFLHMHLSSSAKQGHDFSPLKLP